MSPSENSTCQEFHRNVGRFLDGELDARAMRATAVHVGRCVACEEEMRQLETLSSALESAVREVVDRVDSGALWRAVAAEIAAVPRPSLLARLRERRAARSGRLTPAWSVPALAAAAALAFYLWAASGPPAAPVDVARVDNRAQIDRLESDASGVALWSEPDQNTTAIWVTSFRP